MAAPGPKRLDVFERYLSIWVALCIVAGVAIGTALPGMVGALSRVEVSHVNLPVAVLIWLMIYPMMLRIDFAALRGVGRRPKGLLIVLFAIRAMEEAGIDLRAHTSKILDRYLDEPWDWVITVCDRANERCPVFPGRTRRLHWSFDDPSRATGTEAEPLQVFRRVRDGIERRIRAWLGERGGAPAA